MHRRIQGDAKGGCAPRGSRAKTVKSACFWPFFKSNFIIQHPVAPRQHGTLHTPMEWNENMKLKGLGVQREKKRTKIMERGRSRSGFSGCPQCTPPYFCRDRAPDCMLVPMRCSFSSLKVFAPPHWKFWICPWEGER